MEIIQYDTIPTDILKGIQEVHQAVFDGDLLKVEKLEKKRLLAFVAVIENRVAGFKLGYEVEPDCFYSWLGGVHPDFQKRGIAASLMMAQHIECKARGYKKVRTYSRNSKKAMLLLNIKSGFDIISTFIDEKGIHKIVLEKKL